MESPTHNSSRSEVSRNERDEKVAQFWSQHRGGESFSPEVYWLANPLVQRRFHALAVKDRPYDHWVNLCVEHFLGPRKPVARILNVGCGDGELDRHLASLGAAEVIEAVDIAPARVALAREKAEEEGRSCIRYSVANVENEALPSRHYDAIFFDSALHHLRDLEGVLRKCAAALGPTGLLFVNEYVGPNRFALSQRERELVTACFRLLPERYRTSLAAHNFGEVLREPQFPDPEAVARDDPSESIRSADILEALETVFEIVEFCPLGGSILHFALDNIAGHFREEDSDSALLLHLLFQIEDDLMKCGELQSHFALVVAHPR